MSAQKTPEELHAFAVKHAPELAQHITLLCGKVIAKGMTGILEEVCRIQQDRDALLVDLKEAAETLRRYEALHRTKNTDESTAKAEINAELASRFEATITKVNGGAL